MSQSLSTFLDATREVVDLYRVPPQVKTISRRLAFARATGRASVVLLYSHFEAYVRGINEEAAAFASQAGVSPASLPEPLRLRHSRLRIDHLAETAWDKRGDQLRSFVSEEASLWSADGSVSLTPARIVDWMDSVGCTNLMRFFQLWGIEDIFTAITRKRSTRSGLWVAIDALVTKRHNIAHGDASEGATKSDIARYIRVTKDFCSRSDSKMAYILGEVSGSSRPW